MATRRRPPRTAGGRVAAARQPHDQVRAATRTRANGAWEADMPPPPSATATASGAARRRRRGGAQRVGQRHGRRRGRRWEWRRVVAAQNEHVGRVAAAAAFVVVVAAVVVRHPRRRHGGEVAASRRVVAIAASPRTPARRGASTAPLFALANGLGLGLALGHRRPTLSVRTRTLGAEGTHERRLSNRKQRLVGRGSEGVGECRSLVCSCQTRAEIRGTPHDSAD